MVINYIFDVPTDIIRKVVFSLLKLKLIQGLRMISISFLNQ